MQTRPLIELCMNRHNLSVSLFAVSLLAVSACAADPTPQPTNPAGDNGKADSPTPDCYVGTGIRPSSQPTPTPELQARWNGWQEAMAIWAQNAEVEQHAKAFIAAANGVAGIQCVIDSDCETHSSDFVGSCRIYYNVGQCVVTDLDPPAVGPAAPSEPDLSCADFTCPTTFQCEQEASTAGIACVLQRCGSGGGGGGRGH